MINIENKDNRQFRSTVLQHLKQEHNVHKQDMAELNSNIKQVFGKIITSITAFMPKKRTSNPSIPERIPFLFISP